MQAINQRGERFILDREVGGGGEARIWTVRNQPQLAAKMYRTPTPTREAKLTAMLAHAPPSSAAVAWPTDLLYQRKQFVGFLMPRVQDSLSIFHVYHPLKRAKLQVTFHWSRFLHHTALNLATVVASIHASGHVIGDLNESNILVNPQALVTLVDTDSFQIRTGSGDTYRSPVGKAEFTPPELQGVDFKQIDRTAAHDHFGLAVLIFHLLMDGVHPFAGVLTSGKSVGRVDLYCMKRGYFPYTPNRRVQPPPGAPAFDRLHPELQAAFERCFVDGHSDPSARPTAQVWRDALLAAKNALTTCSADPAHLYSDHLGACPECVVQRRAQRQARVAALQHTNSRFMAGLRAPLRMFAGLRPANPFMLYATSKRGVRYTIHNSTQSWRRTRRQAKTQMATLSELPARLENAWIAARPFAALWSKWTLVSTIFLPLIYLVNESVLPVARGFWGMNTNESLAHLVGMGLSAGVLGFWQSKVLRATFLRRTWDGWLWTLTTAGAGVLGGTFAFAAAETAIPILQGLIFGGILGVVQGAVLSRYRWPVRRRQIWATLHALGGGLLGVGWMLGAEQTATVMGTLAGGALGGLASGVLTGTALVWMVRGTRFAPQLSFSPTRFRLHKRMRLRHHWRSMGATRWWLSLLVTLLVVLTLAGQSLGWVAARWTDGRAAAQTTQERVAPPLPQPIRPGLGQR